jgi:hypothetical protein
VMRESGPEMRELGYFVCVYAVFVCSVAFS